MMRGIILAGGKGTRLYPATWALSKQLLPVYDKPMIYYPLSVLMLAGIRDVLILSTPEHLPLYKKIFSDGSALGLHVQYQAQDEPHGIAEGVLLAEKFIADAPFCFVLGDNIFYGHNLTRRLVEAAELQSGALIYGYHVDDPRAYGVAEIDSNNRIIGIEEKPQQPKSHYAIPGLYFFDGTAPKLAATLKPSARKELEITGLLNCYLAQKKLAIEILGRGAAWLDTGTHESLMQASAFVHTIEKRQGLKIACLEEIAYFKGFIDLEKLKSAAQKTEKSDYGVYLAKLIARIESGKLPVHTAWEEIA